MMIPMMSEESGSKEKFFNLTPEEKLWFDLKEKEKEEETELYKRVVEGLNKSKDSN
ncbi:hypothetical protein VKA52_02670 [Halobacillus sp. HZG1]|uniref:hypothetical protein n=1 Tax=Halobacillus sp. HZG1 TaxID=3111769 RepID=UPI002DBDC1A5|nr:hypothetical protein [Halobacillus sp. HZG1]MEC3882628.1 hypothetical protein [Halobacillus sp. HZG1]